MKKILALTLVLMSSVATHANAGWFDWLFGGDKKPADTKNPIMLVPGIFAFDTIAIVDYWYQIPAKLEKEGAEVYVASINAFDSSVGRGEDLIAQLEDIKAASGGRIEKFNLMGHSQGGTTSRYVMETRPDLIASVTTMHTPHKGTPIADLVNSAFPPNTVGGTLFSTFANAVGDLINLLSDNTADDADIQALLGEFTQDGAAQFNATYTKGLPSSSCGEGAPVVNINGNDIRLYSWSGTGKLTSAVDISDALFTITSLAFGLFNPNDGITGKCSSRFGDVIRDNYNMNHLDANNQIFGLVSILETNPKTLYVKQAERLKNAGL